MLCNFPPLFAPAIGKPCVLNTHTLVQCLRLSTELDLYLENQPLPVTSTTVNKREGTPSLVFPQLLTVDTAVILNLELGGHMARVRKGPEEGVLGLMCATLSVGQKERQRSLPPRASSSLITS